MLWIWVSAVYQETRKRCLTFRAPKMVNFWRSSRTTIFSVEGMYNFLIEHRIMSLAKFFQIVSMDVENFETGVLVQKFHQGSAIYVHFFQKRTLARLPLALEFFTPTNLLKMCFYNTKEMQFDHRIKFLRKIQMSKKPFLRYFFGKFYSAASLLSCLSEKKSRFFRKNSTFLVQKTFFLKSTILVKFCD